MASNQKNSQPLPKSSGLAQSLATTRTTLNTTRPVTIGRAVPTSTSSTITRNPNIRQVAASAPVASFMPPKPPSSRPNVPQVEPPLFDLPPSVPETSFLEDQIANMVVKEEDENCGEDDIGDCGVGVAINKPINKPVAPKQPQPAASMGRSLTNNTGYLAMSCPNVDFVNQKNGDKQSADLGMGRSPTIFSIMSGLDDKIGTPSNGLGPAAAPVNHSSRASTNRPAMPPLAAQRRYDDIADEDEDEDDDFGLEGSGDEDDDLQFNLTLDA
eukprot:TRINITY_DN95351_c0_g1_i1.p1 TRINITY_DN95351_c0_g1~~TRINITY_DN95351_c0_g1_i1.p1  ORF type:complete len:270 (+),score=53.51 TRINITY_DN95351_c0_g1_i1:54-863(+)